MTDKTLHSANGAPVVDNNNSLTASPRGPTLMQAIWLMETLTHFDRERIPERVVHAKCSGAYGTFTVTHDISQFSKADLFNAVGKQTPVFLRFSTVAGEKGAADAERDVLGAIAYQPNDVVLHPDASLLPRHRKAWAAWNAFVPGTPGAPCTVSYCMNLLQGLPGDTPLIVTLNRSRDIDPARILQRRQYAHPVHTHAAVAAQARRHEIQGVQRTWFAGAYWGWGFHEDGIRSGEEVAAALQAHAVPRLRAVA